MIVKEALKKEENSSNNYLLVGIVLIAIMVISPLLFFVLGVNVIVSIMVITFLTMCTVFLGLRSMTLDAENNSTLDKNFSEVRREYYK